MMSPEEYRARREREQRMQASVLLFVVLGSLLAWSCGFTGGSEADGHGDRFEFVR